MGRQAQERKARRRAVALSIVLSSLEVARRQPQARRIPLPAGKSASDYTQAELQNLAADALEAGFIVTEDYRKAVVRAVRLIRGLYGPGAFSIDPDINPCPVYVPLDVLQAMTRSGTFPHRDGIQLMSRLIVAADDTVTFLVAESDSSKVVTIDLSDDAGLNEFYELFFQSCNKLGDSGLAFGLLVREQSKICVNFFERSSNHG